jgi:hypothetical protein
MSLTASAYETPILGPTAQLIRSAEVTCITTYGLSGPRLRTLRGESSRPS